MSSDKSPTKSSRSGASSDSHTKLSGSQKNTKESSKATRRPLLSSSTERIDEPTPLKKVTPVKSQQQSPRSRTKSESSDKAISEDGEGQKKSKAELRAERRAIQVGIVSLVNNSIYLQTGSAESIEGTKTS